MNVLVFGLPGSGKSTFAKKLAADNLAYFNADEVRKMFTFYLQFFRNRVLSSSLS